MYTYVKMNCRISILQTRIIPSIRGNMLKLYSRYYKCTLFCYVGDLSPHISLQICRRCWWTLQEVAALATMPASTDAYGCGTDSEQAGC